MSPQINCLGRNYKLQTEFSFSANFSKQEQKKKMEHGIVFYGKPIILSKGNKGEEGGGDLGGRFSFSKYSSTNSLVYFADKG